MEAGGGIEPPHTGFADPRITTLLPSHATRYNAPAVLGQVVHCNFAGILILHGIDAIYFDQAGSMSGSSSPSFSSAVRQNMLKSQIFTGNVLKQSIADALMAVSREAFVPVSLKGVAYVDEEIPLGHGRFLMEPLAFARLLDQSGISRQDTVLDVGCASGYSAAVLSHMALSVVAVESNPELARQARENLKGLANVALFEVPLTEGVQPRSPFDVILIQGAVEFIPQMLADQLKEGGRIVTFESNARKAVGVLGLGSLVEYRKINNTLYRSATSNASVAPLEEFNKPQGFVF